MMTALEERSLVSLKHVAQSWIDQFYLYHFRTNRHSTIFRSVWNNKM